MENEIIVYQANAESLQVEVRIDEETVWLSLDQMSLLFERDKSVISRHIRNIFSDKELIRDSVVAKNATTAADGKMYQVEYYNLDVIISVGYRVKSLRGVQFRRWATGILKEHLLRGYSIRQELQHLEDKLDRRLTEHAQVLEEHQKKIDFILKTELKPTQGVFFQGHTEAVHDRFIILDGEAVFHLGASLKDLGKKCFAFSRMDKSWAGELMAMLKD